MKSLLAQRYLTIIDDLYNLIAKARADGLKRIGKIKHMEVISTEEERLKTLNNKVGLCLEIS